MKAVLFDIGNVLVSFDFTLAAQRLAAQSDATAEEVLSLLTPFKDDLESGRIPDEAFVEQAMSRIGFRGTPEEFIEIWGDIFAEHNDMTALVEKLAAEYPLYLLSNTSGLHKNWLFEKFPVFAHFKGGTYSHEAGCMKPHDPIYHKVIEAHQLDPAQTFYIDDLPDNIEAGRRWGFVCHLYDPKQHDALEVALHDWFFGNG